MVGWCLIQGTFWNGLIFLFLFAGYFLEVFLVYVFVGPFWCYLYAYF